MLHKAGDTTVIDGASHTYDNAGNRLSKSNYLDNSSEQYVYDALYQLTQVTRNNAVSESYTYDKVGNRLSSLLRSTRQQSLRRLGTSLRRRRYHGVGRSGSPAASLHRD